MEVLTGKVQSVMQEGGFQALARNQRAREQPLHNSKKVVNVEVRGCDLRFCKHEITESR